MAIHRTISDFKSALQGGGARPNLFEVSIPTFPLVTGEDILDTNLNTNFNFPYEPCFTTSNVAPIEVPFRGRTLKIAMIERLILGLLQSSTMKTLQSELQ